MFMESEVVLKGAIQWNDWEFRVILGIMSLFEYDVQIPTLKSVNLHMEGNIF